MNAYQVCMCAGFPTYKCTYIFRILNETEIGETTSIAQVMKDCGPMKTEMIENAQVCKKISPLYVFIMYS